MKRLTPDLCRELAGYARVGQLMSLTIVQTQTYRKGGAKFSVEYQISDYSYATTENFNNRQSLANRLMELADLIQQKRVANIRLRMENPVTSSYELQLTTVTVVEEENTVDAH